MAGPVGDWLRSVPLAHRGLHDSATGVLENSLAAFAAAADAGYGMELDVHLSADGEVVVVHDDDLTRLTGEAVRVTTSRWDALTELVVTGTAERLPRLADVFDVVGARVPVMVEIKNAGRSAGPLEAAVAAVARAHPGPVTVASFNPLSVAWFARNAPDVLRGQTVGSLEGLPVPAPLAWFLRTLTTNRVTHPHYVSAQLSMLPDPAVDRWRERGLPVIAWTATSQAELDHAATVADNVIFERVLPDLPTPSHRVA